MDIPKVKLDERHYDSIEDFVVITVNNYDVKCIYISSYSKKEHVHHKFVVILNNKDEKSEKEISILFRELFRNELFHIYVRTMDEYKAFGTSFKEVEKLKELPAAKILFDDDMELASFRQTISRTYHPVFTARRVFFPSNELIDNIIHSVYNRC